MRSWCRSIGTSEHVDFLAETDERHESILVGAVEVLFECGRSSLVAPQWDITSLLSF